MAFVVNLDADLGIFFNYLL